MPAKHLRSLQVSEVEIARSNGHFPCRLMPFKEIRKLRATSSYRVSIESSRKAVARNDTRRRVQRNDKAHQTHPDGDAFARSGSDRSLEKRSVAQNATAIRLPFELRTPVNAEVILQWQVTTLP